LSLVEHLDEVEVDREMRYMSGAKREQCHLNQAKRIKMMNKNRVINETKSSDSLLSHGLDDVVMNRKKRGFNGMVGCLSIEKCLEGDWTRYDEFIA